MLVTGKPAPPLSKLLLLKTLAVVPPSPVRKGRLLLLRIPPLLLFCGTPLFRGRFAPLGLASVSIYYAPESDLRVKSYGRLNSPRASVLNFEDLDI